MNSRAIKLAAFGTLALGVKLSAYSAASVDTFGSGSNAFTIDFVEVGNAGNADDAGAGGGLYSSPYGGVSYVYRMGVTEVPQDWIDKATNLGMTNVTAGAWTGLQPAANMNWYEAAAFVNWLNTSTGHHAAYNLMEIPPVFFNNTWSMALWSSAEAWQLDGENLYRHKDAYYFLPSEDEWYKAAYHKNDGATGNYWDYATAGNSRPIQVLSGTLAGTAVAWTSAPAAVDNNGGLSAYGTRGQTGNMLEWTESAGMAPNDDAAETRVWRGGWWDPASWTCEYRGTPLPAGLSSEASLIGFRVASVVPEPSCALLMLSGSLLASARRRRADLARQ